MINVFGVRRGNGGFHLPFWTVDMNGRVVTKNFNCLNESIILADSRDPYSHVDSIIIRVIQCQSNRCHVLIDIRQKSPMNRKLIVRLQNNQRN